MRHISFRLPAVEMRLAGLPFLFLILTLATCQDEPASPEPAQIAASAAQVDREQMPIDSLHGDTPFLNISRELPSFGGFYYAEDNEQVVVGLTNTEDLRFAEVLIRPYLGSAQPANGFVAEEVQYSYLDLARIRTQLLDRVFDVPGVVSLGVAEAENRVSIGVDPERSLQARESVRGMMDNLQIQEDFIRFREQPVPTEDHLASHTIRSQHPQGWIQGGWQIGTGDVWCTLGFSARAAGNDVFVTNSHCTDVPATPDGTDFGQPTVSSYVGSETSDPSAFSCSHIFPCRHSDAALIDAAAPIDFGKIVRTTERLCGENSHASLLVDHSSPTLTITTRNGHVFENQTLDKIGRTTGWTCGAVESTCDDVETSGWVKLCSDRVDYSAEDGDSGSPVFRLTPGGNVDLRGIHWGSAGWPYNDAWMSDLA